MRLIDADKLLEKVQFRMDIDNKNAEIIAGCVDITRRLIENEPTVDVEKVVHCMECRHWIERTADGIDTFHTCWFNDSITGRNHFCRYGERRTDE